jgi:hypothetical protein
MQEGDKLKWYKVTLLTMSNVVTPIGYKGHFICAIYLKDTTFKLLAFTSYAHAIL